MVNNLLCSPTVIQKRPMCHFSFVLQSKGRELSEYCIIIFLPISVCLVIMLSFNQFWKLQRLNNFTEGWSVCSYARESRWDLWQYKNNKVHKTINKPAFLCFVRRQDLRGSRPDRINIRNPGTRRHNDMRGLTRLHMSSVCGHECMKPKRHAHTDRHKQTHRQNLY